MNAPKKNTRRAAMDAERLDWKCFRFVDDGRKWKRLAMDRRAYFVKAANAADADGTHVEISAKTFMKAGGERATAFRRLDDLAQMGACLPVLHIDPRGHERELLSVRLAKVRRLRFESLTAAQEQLDRGEKFLGHVRLSSDQQLEIQRDWLYDGKSSRDEVSDSHVTESQIHVKESQIACEEVSHTREQVSDSRKQVSDSCKGVSPCVIRNRKVFTEGKDRERETEAENSKASPSPSTPHAPSGAAASENPEVETSGQKKAVSSEDVTLIMARVCNLSGKTPAESRVREVLEMFDCADIMWAFDRYYRNQPPDSTKSHARAHAERMFFQEGGWRGAIPAYLFEQWQEGLREFVNEGFGYVRESVDPDADSIEVRTVDEWLAGHPAPKGFHEWRTLVENAKRDFAKLHGSRA
jgi:hypothetical protein